MSEVKILTETTNINNLTEQPAILEHVARLNDEIANLTAQCNTFKEQLEASEKSRHNLRLFANNETYFDLPMSGPDIDTRNRLFELRAEARADELRKQAFSESVSRCVQKVQQMVVERENLKTERDTALRELARVKVENERLRAECESLRESLATCDEPNEGGYGYCGICGHEHKCIS